MREHKSIWQEVFSFHSHFVSQPMAQTSGEFSNKPALVLAKEPSRKQTQDTGSTLASFVIVQCSKRAQEHLDKSDVCPSFCMQETKNNLAHFCELLPSCSLPPFLRQGNLKDGWWESRPVEIPKVIWELDQMKPLVFQEPDHSVLQNK